MKFLVIVLTSLTIISCSKESMPTDCNLTATCWATQWSFTTCDDGVSFTNVGMDLKRNEISCCDTLSWKQDIQGAWARAAADYTQVEKTFFAGHKNECGCY